MSSVYAVIMAGGRGERFWPLTTDQRTKPFIPLLGNHTLIQDTVARLQLMIPPENIMISIGEAHADLARAQLPQISSENLILEPVGRDTSACLGFCALHLERRDPDAIMLAIPADHFIRDDEAYRKTLRKGIENLEGASGVVFGVRPVRPDTGYGYIRAKRPESPAEARSVLAFVEKPDAGKASEYMRSGDYFWNSGIFIWRNQTLLELFQQHMPSTHQGLTALRPLLGRPARDPELHRIFSSLERISVDFGILQKMSGLRMIAADFGWDDIGSWTALERALTAGADGHIAHGPHVSVDSNNCIVFSDAGTIASYGVSDLVIVQANGKVLVCSKDRAADLKRLVGALGPRSK